MTMRFLPVNLDALLVELDDLDGTLALLASLQAEPVVGIEEVVPAARTLLIRYAPGVVDHAQLVARLGARRLAAAVERQGPRVEIPVSYRGEDLDEVAGLLGIDRAEVVRRHTGSDYTVAFTGFAPGFAYLVGGDPGLQVPRRKTPRIRIPAGAVAIAGPYSGVYPRPSPGGWQIIGVTTTSMWDLARDPPALLQPGARVRFVDVTGQAPAAAPAAATRSIDAPRAPATADSLDAPRAPAIADSLDAPRPPPTAASLDVVATGLQTLFQDLGRPGQARQGVSASGALDRAALRSANRLVGNPVDFACLETVYGGLSFVCRGQAVVAVTGADATVLLTTASGATVALRSHRSIGLNDGDRLTLGEPRAGIRCYLAVRGGFAVRPVLGSCATDTLANVGPPAVAAGNLLPIRPLRNPCAAVGGPERPPADLPTCDRPVLLDVVLGPRTDWFSAAAVERLSAQEWTVTPQSNRVGLRLAGEQPLTRIDDAELPSEGTAPGALQVPPSGQPVLFLADHPLTGGYPVIASVATYHLDRAGQVPIGARLRFRPIRHPGLACTARSSGQPQAGGAESDAATGLDPAALAAAPSSSTTPGHIRPSPATPGHGSDADSASSVRRAEKTSR